MREVWKGFIIAPVSYTHLDVYKRQGRSSPPSDGGISPIQKKTPPFLPPG